MPARHSLELIWRHRRLLLGSVVACLALAAVLALTADRTYESRTQFLVSTASTREDVGTAYEAELFSQQRVTTYAEIVSSPQLLERVARELALPGGAGELAGRVEAAVIPETALIDVTASAGSPEDAREIAEALSGALPRYVEELERPGADAPSPVRLAVTRNPELPTAAASPNVRLYLVLGLLAGLAVGAAFLALAAAFDDRGRSVATLERLAGTPVLGTVAEDPRGGPPVLLDDPLSPRAEEYRRVRAQIEARWRDAGLGSLVVAGLGSSGGSAAVAANLGVALARGGRRVAVVDADPDAAGLSELLGVGSAPGLADVLGAGVAPDAALTRIGELPLVVLGAGSSRIGPGDPLSAPQLPAVIAALREHADVVIVHAPPLAHGADASTLAPVASAVLIVAAPDAPAAELEAAEHALGPPSGRLGVVVNRRAAGRSRAGRAPDRAIAGAPAPAADGAKHAAGRS